MGIYFFLPAKAGFFIGFSLFVLSFYLYNEKKRRMGGTYGMKIKTYEADVVVLNEEKGFAALKKAAESGRMIFLMRTGEEWLSICWWKSPSPRALLPYPEILTSM